MPDGTEVHSNALDEKGVGIKNLTFSVFLVKRRL